MESRIAIPRGKLQKNSSEESSYISQPLLTTDKTEAPPMFGKSKYTKNTQKPKTLEKFWRRNEKANC